MPLQDEHEIARQKKLKEIRKEEEEDLAERTAKKAGLPYINLRLRTIPAKALRVIPEEKARAANVIAFEYVGNSIALAVADPENPLVKTIVDELSPLGNVDIYVASKSAIREALAGYAMLPKKVAKITGELTIAAETEELFKKTQNTFQAISDILSSLETEDISRLVEYLFAAAISIDASDIHIEPTENVADVRLRIDGVLHQIFKLTKKSYGELRDRLKLLSGMKLNIHEKAQDGRISVKRKETPIEIRASVTPGAYGESIVMRLLDPGKIALTLEDLGIRKKDLDKFIAHLERPNGMILNTGPTGSGKTTTLYAFLKKKRTPGIKIITIEDPIEYHLEGISQTQVDRERGYDFAAGLRAALRQDPDVILVGEIRDAETSKTALNAALTGHLVFSTLHTNEAVGTVARLEELGIEAKAIPSAVNLVIAQRLVRRLCPKCKEKYAPDEKTKEAMLKALAIISPKAGIEIPEDITALWRAKGCSECWGLGYKGQIGLFEYFEMSKRMTEAIISGASVAELREAAIDDGMLTLLQDGYLKAVEGITDIEEVARVAGETAEYVETLYEKTMAQKLRRGVKLDKTAFAEIEKAVKSKDGISKLLEKAPQRELLALIMGAALASRATDIHFEAKEKEALIRFRIDGILYDIHKVTLELYPTLISEIKILGGLKVEVHDRIQEGRFSITVPQETRDVRVSLIPGGYGETAVLRILLPEGKILTLQDIGILAEELQMIEKELMELTGIILVAGPTSSGKTTTLYALTERLNSPAVKIITIEDPVEYRLEGVLQTQIDVEKGYTFAAALRSILRQNPNIILIGEIRDTETAGLAVQASLTGHLVLSTVHAMDAVSVVARLENLGVKAEDIAQALRSVFAQRLVRRLCPECGRGMRPAKAQEEKIIRETLKDLPPKWEEVFRDEIHKPHLLPVAKGCAKCNFTGYRGQIGIFEILIPDSAFREELATKGTLHLPEIAHKAGMMTLKQDGIIKVLRGLTTLEEIDRVL